MCVCVCVYINNGMKPNKTYEIKRNYYESKASRAVNEHNYS